MLVFGLDNLPIEQVYDLKLDHDRKDPAWTEPADDIAAFMRTKFISNHPVGLAAFTRRLLDAEDRIDEVAGDERPPPGAVRRARRRLAAADPGRDGRSARDPRAGDRRTPATPPRSSSRRTVARLLVEFFHDH